eukprot:534151-Heterocapsa_arctica.AAC.1
MQNFGARKLPRLLRSTPDLGVRSQAKVAGVEEVVKVWEKTKPCQPKQVVGPHLDHGHDWEDL